MDLINRKFIQEMNTVPLLVVDFLKIFSLLGLVFWLLELCTIQLLIEYGTVLDQVLF
jgi:hypothetical protein